MNLALLPGLSLATKSRVILFAVSRLGGMRILSMNRLPRVAAEQEQAHRNGKSGQGITQVGQKIIALPLAHRRDALCDLVGG